MATNFYTKDGRHVGKRLGQGKGLPALFTWAMTPQEWRDLSHEEVMELRDQGLLIEENEQRFDLIGQEFS